jgi:hypothetical protein
MRRYRVTQRPPDWRTEVLKRTEEHRPWVILDGEVRGYCTLPEGANRLPLEWTSKEAAEAWLARCYRVWGRIPLIDGEAMPYDPRKVTV